MIARTSFRSFLPLRFSCCRRSFLVIKTSRAQRVDKKRCSRLPSLCDATLISQCFVPCLVLFVSTNSVGKKEEEIWKYKKANKSRRKAYVVWRGWDIIFLKNVWVCVCVCALCVTSQWDNRFHPGSSAVWGPRVVVSVGWATSIFFKNSDKAKIKTKNIDTFTTGARLVYFFTKTIWAVCLIYPICSIHRGKLWDNRARSTRISSIYLSIDIYAACYIHQWVHTFGRDVFAISRFWISQFLPNVCTSKMIKDL